MQVFGLDREEITLGRDCEKCSVMIPEGYTRVSRIHARIERAVDGVYINDRESTNGTFVKGQRVTKSYLLSDGDQITLGGAEPSDKVCLLKFSTRAHRPYRPITTEVFGED